MGKQNLQKLEFANKKVNEKESEELASVAELVDALDLGSSGVSRVGSSPTSRIFIP